MNRDRFALQEKYLDESVWSSLCVVIFSPIVAVLFCMLAKQSAWWFLAALLFVAIIPIAFISFLHNRKLLKQIQSIEKSSVNETNDVVLYRPKTSFLAVGRVRRGFSTVRSYTIYFGIVLTDARKGKYYYLYREGMKLDKGDIARLKEKFYREIHIQCYENTRIIKTIEDDPYFANIKFGSYYD